MKKIRRKKLTKDELAAKIAGMKEGTFMKLEPSKLDAEARRSLFDNVSERIKSFERSDTRTLAIDGSEVINESIGKMLKEAAVEKVPLHFKERIKKAEELGLLPKKAKGIYPKLLSIATVRRMFAHDTSLYDFDWDKDVIHEVEKSAPPSPPGLQWTLKQRYWALLYVVASQLENS